jgi:arginyl-tRNA synthetase
MQLAKAVEKATPVSWASSCVQALLALPSYQHWVQDIEIAGPGFINLRLKPAAKQQIVVLSARSRFGIPRLDALALHKVRERQQRASACWSSSFRPTPPGPLHVGHGRQAALGDAICNLLETQGLDVYREFYYNDAGVQINTLAKSTQLRAQGFKPGDDCWPTDPDNPASKAFYNGEYIADIAADFLAKKTVTADDRSFTASGDVNDLNGMRQFAVAYLRHEQDLDLKAFEVKFDNYYLRVQPLHRRQSGQRGRSDCRAAGKTYEQDGALWLKSTDYGDDKDRVMRKSDGTFTYFVPDVAYHIAKWQRGFSAGGEYPRQRPPRHHRTRACGFASGRGGGHSRGLSRLRVAHHGARDAWWRRGQNFQARGQLCRRLRDLIEWTSKDAVRFFLLSRKPDTEYTFDVDLAVTKNNDNPVYYVQYAHARICSVLRKPGPVAQRAATWLSLTSCDLSALDSPPAQALDAALGQIPRHAERRRARLCAARRDLLPA